MSERKAVLLSGIQPSGNLMIGNYVGALDNWVRLQDEYDCLFVLVDMHAITIRQDPKALRERCYDFLALYMACGLDPEKHLIFVQSHVPAHAELAWVLSCFTYMGELNRMTQFKDKAKKQGVNVGAGLFNYPTLMAADILLYQAELVPVGEDQKQHLEMTRDIAERFNNIYSETFRIPEIFVPPLGARVMSLQNPKAKMSKSDEDEDSYLALLDPPDVIRNKIKKAVTDSGKEIVYDEEKKSAVSNLLTIHSCLSGESLDSLAEKYAGKGYAVFKQDLAEVVVEALRPIQERYRKIREDHKGLTRTLARGGEEARKRARATMDKVYDKLGFIPAP